jgi:copper chaperone
MKKYQLKTNIKCSGCIANVTPVLNNEKAIESWNVDIQDANKVLTVTSSGIDEPGIIALVEKAGYKAEKLPGTNT